MKSELNFAIDILLLITYMLQIVTADSDIYLKN